MRDREIPGVVLAPEGQLVAKSCPEYPVAMSAFIEWPCLFSSGVGHVYLGMLSDKGMHSIQKHSIPCIQNGHIYRQVADIAECMAIYS